jgi:hypothetical protein
MLLLGGAIMSNDALLYHYTRVDRVEAIKRDGLLPHIDEMSPERLVVWLTMQPDVSVTPVEADWLAQHFGLLEGDLADLRAMEADQQASLCARPVRSWWYGSKGERLTLKDGRIVTFVPVEDDLVRLTIALPADDPALQRYCRWPHRPLTPVHRAMVKLPLVRQWWV